MVGKEYLGMRASPKGCEKIDAKTMYWGLC
jgi:hypothetical protein